MKLKIWYKIRKIANENKTKLLEKGFRVDWIGRIYTVINLPEEVVTAAYLTGRVRINAIKRT